MFYAGHGIQTGGANYLVPSDARIEIEDDGEGVPEQLQERVFDLGYTTKESDQPAGIGLTIGRHLARAHGGDLKIESVDEGGGLQVLTLPRVED